MPDKRVEDIEAAHLLAEREDEARIVVDCGHVAIPDFFLVPNWRDLADTPGKGVTGTPGYGTYDDGTRKCFACIGKEEIEALKTAQTVFAYLSADGKRITNWPGTTLGRITRLTTSKAARKTFVRATDVHGAHWYGQGPAETGTYVRLRRRTTNNQEA